MIGYILLGFLVLALAWYGKSQEIRAERAEYWIDEIIIELQKAVEED